jgi:hypothetical protein
MSKEEASCAVGLGRDGKVAATLFWGNPCNRTFGGLESAISVVAEAQETAIWEDRFGEEPFCGLTTQSRELNRREHTDSPTKLGMK